jgi:hypothetical protein
MRIIDVKLEGRPPCFGLCFEYRLRGIPRLLDEAFHL